MKNTSRSLRPCGADIKNEKQNGLYCWFRLCRFTVSRSIFKAFEDDWI